MEGLRAKEQDDVRKAALLELHAEEIDALLTLLRNGVSSGMVRADCRLIA